MSKPALPWPEIIETVTGDKHLSYRVRHDRFYGDTGELITKGGTTTVTLGLVVGDEHKVYVETARGVAVCNPLDVYDRKVGRDIALRRALENWKILYKPKEE